MINSPSFIEDLVTNDGLYDRKAFYKVKIVFIHTLSKIIPSQQNCWHYLIDADIISFFVASKGKKTQKIDENN